MPINLDDIQNLEEGAASEDELLLSIQRLINSGSAWSLQGAYGRSMMAAIEAGTNLLGHKPARDYYGNFIPSRTMVQAGTKGSIEYVEKLHGAEWAKKIAAVK